MSLLTTLDRLSHWLVRGRVLDGASLARLQFLIGCVVVGLLVSLPSLAMSPGPGVAGIVVFAVGSTALLLLIRAGVSLRRVEVAEMVLVALFLVFMSLQTRLLVVTQLYWFALLPLIGGLLLGQGAGVILGGSLGLVCVLAVAVLHELGATFDEPALGEAAALVDAVLFLVAIALLTLVYEYLRSRALARAEHEVNARRDFMAVMSHELRTPMHGVLGLTQLLADTELSAEQRERLALIHRSGDAMVTLINELLDFSKLEAGELVLEAVPLSVEAIARDVVELCTAQLFGRPVELNLRVAPEVPAWLLGDPLRLRQVLHNLVNNAVKFTQRGRIDVELKWQQAVLSGVVRDEGIGMGPEVLARLFRPFQQADASTARTFGGSGLGLAISRELCTRMGGALNLDSKTGHGTTVSFSARLPQTDAPAPAEPSAATSPALRGRVLVVEDNPVNQLIAKGLCTRLGLSVEVVGDGAAALARLELEPFDLVLMDCLMPVMDGYEATQQLRARPAPTNQVPVVALTASGSEADLARCTAAGMNEVIVKPVSAARLEAVLRRHLKQF